MCDRSQSEREVLLDGIETCYDAWFRGGAPDKKTRQRHWK